MLDDGIPVVNLDSDFNGSNEDDNSDNNGCNCGCEDNVTEFGNIPTIKPDEKNNVVEF